MAAGGMPATSEHVEPFPVKSPSVENFAEICEEILPLKGPAIKDSCVHEPAPRIEFWRSKCI